MKQAFTTLVAVIALSTSGMLAPHINAQGTATVRTNKFLVPQPPGWGKNPDASMVKAVETKHDAILKMRPDIIFVGDSITDYWRKEGAALWEKHFAPLNAANYGVGGLRTSGALWAIKEFKWEGVSPKIVVLLIGANDGDAGKDLFLGQKNLVQCIHQTFPSARIVFIPILPSNIKFQGKTNRYPATNKFAPELEKEFNYVKVLDLTSKMLDDKGEVTKEIFKDGQHLSEKGYQIWAEALLPVIKPLLNAK